MALDLEAQLARIQAATTTLPDTDLSEATQELKTLEQRLAKIFEKQPRIEAVVGVGELAIGFGMFNAGAAHGFFHDVPPVTRVSVFDNPKLVLALYANVTVLLDALETLVTPPGSAPRRS